MSSHNKNFLKILAFLSALGLLVMAALSQQAGMTQQPRPLTGLAAIHVPKGFTVEQAAGPDLAPYVMFASLDDRGRLFLCQSTSPNTMTTEDMLKNPSYVIRLLEDTDGDGIYDKSKLFADRLPLPQGAVWYRGSLYVTAAPDLLRFDDTNDDGVADRREIVLTGWTLSVNGALLHGPFFGPDGWLYLTDARRGYKIKTKEGATLEGKGARIWRCRPDGTGLEQVSAGGFDNPVELIFTPAGEIIGTMTYFSEPKQGQRDALIHWVEGGVYPKPHPVIEELKRTGDLMPVMTKFARIAPSGLARYRGTAFGPEYRGNLFSAQFNPHRVQRHKLFRDSATFRTEDEDFLTSDDPYFHPTDVLEDVDGSLLVVDTGGWFIKGCPLSIVERPEVRGAIYRVRRKDSPRIKDPRGNALKLETRAPAQLTSYLKDSRPAVQDKAVELLVQAGERAVDPLAEMLRSSAPAEVRCAALFALFRIGTPKAEQILRAALKDTSLQVRVAAARAIGMARDGEAVGRLIEMVRNDSAPVRRQAAAALGQIGDDRAVAALIAASANPDDRFVEHSIIFSLMTLQKPAPLVGALKDPSPKVRKAALIALDQMENSPLKAEQLTALLSSADKDLRHAALWIASRHPQWSGNVLAFLRSRLRDPKLSVDEAEALGEALVSFCRDSSVQQMMAELLGDPASPAERKILLLDTMDRCPLKQLPTPWIQSVGGMLKDADIKERSRAVALIRSHQISEWADELTRIASNDAETADLRTAALGALVATHPQLSPSHFTFLLRQLAKDKEAALRLAASQVLGHARLNEPDLKVIARRYIPEADPLILPGLLDAFRGTGSREVGEALVAGLLKSSQGLETFGEKQLQQLFAAYPEPVQKSAKPLLDRFQKVRQARVQRLQQLESRLSGGDVARGLKIFFGQKVACSSCHTIGAQGGQVGPDLTSVGAIRSRHDLLEAIIFPSASFVREHETYRVETRDEVYSGIRAEQTADSIVLVTGPDSKLRIPRDKILSMQPSNVSLMPEGLDQSLTRPELADLIAFLEAQK